jgi:uncharacterized protein
MDEDLTREIRRWGVICHLAALSWLPVSAIAWSPGHLFVPIPFINIIFTFMIWRWRRNWHDFIDEQGRESLNFQLSQLIYALILLLLFVFLIFLSCGVSISSGSNWFGSSFSIVVIVIGILMLVLVLSQITLSGFAAVKAWQGQSYRYPFTLRFLN